MNEEQVNTNLVQNKSPNNSVTLVTCYYKFPSKHSHQSYDSWIRNLFYNITNANVIIFTSPDLEQYIRNIANTHKTNQIHIICRPFDELEVNVKYKHIWEDQYSKDPTPHIRTKECYIIWNSKMAFLREAIQLNPFNSDKFIWNDIGSMRDTNFSSRIQTYPQWDKVSNDKIDIVLVYPFNNPTQIYYYHESHLSGAIFGGGIKACLDLIDLFYQNFEDYLSQNFFIGCDQQVLATTYIKNPQLFNPIKPINNAIDPWFYLYYHFIHSN